MSSHLCTVLFWLDFRVPSMFFIIAMLDRKKRRLQQHIRTWRQPERLREVLQDFPQSRCFLGTLFRRPQPTEVVVSPQRPTRYPNGHLWYTVLIVMLAHKFNLTYNQINAPQLRVPQHSNTSNKNSYARSRKLTSHTSNYNAAEQRKRMSRKSDIQTRRTRDKQRNNNNKLRTNPLANTPIKRHKGDNTNTHKAFLAQFANPTQRLRKGAL